jgi:hypothetical protein
VNEIHGRIYIEGIHFTSRFRLLILPGIGGFDLLYRRVLDHLFSGSNELNLICENDIVELSPIDHIIALSPPPVDDRN